MKFGRISRTILQKILIFFCFIQFLFFLFNSSHQTCPPNTRAFAENASSPETHIGTNTRTYQRNDDEDKIENAVNAPDGNHRSANEPIVAGTSSKQTVSSENDERKLWNHSMKSSSTYLSLASRPRQQKYVEDVQYFIHIYLF